MRNNKKKNLPEGFMKKYTDKLLKTFEVLVEYLEKGGYKWVAWSGTCLGAVRHKGIIPWDDDVDIAMPRLDYERFLKNFKSSKDYYLISKNNNENYPFTFAKFCDGSSTILETNGINAVFGIYVDVFPLDYIDNPFDEIVQKKLSYHDIVRKYERACNTYYPRHIFNMIRGCRILNLKVILEDLLYFKRKKEIIFSQIKLIDDSCCDYITDYIVSFSGIYKEKEIFKSDWLEETVMVPFEYFQVRIPKKYDQVLRHTYGDYMQLPPEDKRVYKHEHVYDNLSVRLTVEEARKRLKNGISVEM